jgi:dethiobiotin synthetase
VRGCVIAGIGTAVGKTITAAIFVEHHQADYWKPVQAGELSNTDSHLVASLAPGANKIHPEAYRLTAPMSPHAAASMDDLVIGPESLALPETEQFLVVEIAGGLMVPLNTNLTNLDMLDEWGLPVVLVCNYYLGSINHTLLSIDALEQHGVDIAGLVFNGEPNEATRTVILERSGLSCLLDIPQAEVIDSDFIRQCAGRLEAE